MSADSVPVRSSFYYEGHYRNVASSIKAYINASQDILSPQTADSPRAVGDALESLVADNDGILSKRDCQDSGPDNSLRHGEKALGIETRHLGLTPKVGPLERWDEFSE